MNLSNLSDFTQVEGRFVSDEPVSTSKNTIEDIEMLQ